MSVSNIPNIIMACCVLHNICGIHRDAFNEIWLDDVHSDQPTSSTTAITSSAAEDIRNTLVL